MIKDNIKAILFDKDGTLIDFLYTWHPLLKDFISQLAKKGNLPEEKTMLLSRALGDNGMGIDGDSVFAHGTFPQILEKVRTIIPHFDIAIMKECFERAVGERDMDARPIGQAQETLGQLKEEGYILGVATADMEANTHHTLKRAGLSHFFDFIGTDETVAKGKPHRDLMDHFCSLYGLKPDQVAMVGDTLRDMAFAQNSGAGQAIFVRSSFPNPEAEELADLVLEDINQLKRPDPVLNTL